MKPGNYLTIKVVILSLDLTFASVDAPAQTRAPMDQGSSPILDYSTTDGALQWTALRAFFKNVDNADCYSGGGAIRIGNPNGIEILLGPSKSQPYYITGSHDPFGKLGPWSWVFRHNNCSLKIRISKELYINNAWDSSNLEPGNPKENMIRPNTLKDYDDAARKIDTIFDNRLIDRSKINYSCPETDGFIVFFGHGLQILLDNRSSISQSMPTYIRRTVDFDRGQYEFFIENSRCRIIFEISKFIDTEGKPIAIGLMPDSD